MVAWQLARITTSVCPKVIDRRKGKINRESLDKLNPNSKGPYPFSNQNQQQPYALDLPPYIRKILTACCLFCEILDFSEGYESMF